MKRPGSIWMIGCLLMMGMTCRAQAPLHPADTSRPQSRPRPAKKTHDLTNTLILDFFTTLNGIKYDNATQADQRSQLYFYYNATANNSLSTKYFTLRSYFFTEYGFHYYFDSVSLKSEDGIRMRHNLQIPFSKHFGAQAGIDLKNQLWKTYAYRPNTAGGYDRYLYTDYSSPGYTIYSLGGTYKFMGDASLDVGLVGGKITRIRNTDIFTERKAKTLYGIKKSERRKVEWGINMQVSVPPKMYGKHFAWELSGNLFAPKDSIGALKSFKADAYNVVHYIFFRHMRLSLRTQLAYDRSVQDKIFWMNALSLGFYLSNRL